MFKIETEDDGVGHVLRTTLARIDDAQSRLDILARAHK